MISWYLIKINLDSLEEYDKNPRVLGEKEHRHISDSLDRFGLIDKPIVNLDKVIIGGHQRISILRLKGVTEVECWFPDRMLDETEVEELNIRLNRNSGDWDYDILANVFDVGNLLSWGFDEDDLGLGKAEKKAPKKKFIISFEFGEKDEMLEHLQACEDIASKAGAKMRIRG